MKKILIKKALIFVTAILVFHLLAYKFYWYASIFGYDKLMHTAGGVFIAFLLSYIFWNRAQQISHKQFVARLVMAVFVVGFVWELYEYAVQALLKPIPFASIADSIGDLVFDTIGGFIGVYFVLHQKKRYNSNND